VFDGLLRRAHHKINGEAIMPARTTSTRANPKVAAKPNHRNGAKPRAKKPRMTKVEAERLAHFKALMLKTGGRGKFAGLDG
jgi:hypothetical protein